MTSDDIGKLRNDAAKLLGWTRAQVGPAEWWSIRHPGGDRELKWARDEWHPDTDANQAALLLAEVDRRGKRDEFARALAKLLSIPTGNSPVGPRVNVFFACANATPLQKTQAAVQALEDRT